MRTRDRVNPKVLRALARARRRAGARSGRPDAEPQDHLSVLLRRVSGQLEQLPALVGRAVAEAVHGARQRLDGDTVDALSALVAELHAEFRRDLFTTRDVVQRAEANDALRTAIEDIVGPPRKGRNMSLGKFFGKVTGVEVGDLAITHVDVKDRNGAFWRLRVCGGE